MKITDIIHKKKKGVVLSKEEIGFAISGFTHGHIPDYQFAALLMAIYFKGLNKTETLELTKAMVASGKTVDLSAIPGIKVDKHSTGGVGDKTSLIVGPLVAAAGIKVAKLSGRGLGHTGGTIDKLESITGFSTDMTIQDFFNNVNEVGVAVGGQTGELVPADKKMYALRDVTGTVDNISLIASSIMSKKIASGADKIVLDVKVGDGAFLDKVEDAYELARQMVEIGEGMGKGTIALITDMHQPLGNAIGNAIEIKEAIDTLHGKGPADLNEICLELAAHMLLVAGMEKNKTKAIAHLEELIHSGKAFAKFKAFIKAQGGDISQVEDTSKLPASKHHAEIHAPGSGYIQHISAKKAGLVSVLLGAGRETKESVIAHGAYIYLLKKAGDHVSKGEPIAKIGTDESGVLAKAKEELLAAYTFGDAPVTRQPLIYGAIFGSGIGWDQTPGSAKR